MPPTKQERKILMKAFPKKTPSSLKARTGIAGFDEITNGGLPRNRTVLLEGGPGSGKTLMALETLVHGARLDREPGTNQVRELILSKDGVTLADVYTAGGEVLMGTLRWEKEQEVIAAREMRQMVAKEKQAKLAHEKAEIEVQLKAMQKVLMTKNEEISSLSRLTTDRNTELSVGRAHLGELRGKDRN